jgi:cell wall-associated NlpC family hydrolase
VTTNDQTFGRTAAHRPIRGLRLLCCALLGAATLPAFAQQVPAATATVSASAVTSPAATTPATLPTPPPAIDASLPLSDRAILFAGDLRRMVGAQPAGVPDAAAAAPALGSRIQTVLQRALALLGTPYRWGGTGTDGFDCSGLVGYVFRNALGIELPRVSRDLAKSGELVSDRALLSPGDLVFFSRRARGKVDHVGIYLGEGRFLHAPRTGKQVEVSSLDNAYWNNRFVQARRVAGL